jgi:TolB-like protein
MVSPEEVREQLARILVSPPFTASQRAGQLLSYLVEQTLGGKIAQLKQTTVAIELLGFDPDFDPDKNPIVRIQISRLRKALDRYYNGPGSADGLMISLAPGSYEAHFSRTVEPAKEPGRLGVPPSTKGPVVGILEFRGIGLVGPWHTLPLVLTEELTITLGSMEMIRTLGPFSRARLDADKTDAVDLARQYDLEFLIDGSIQMDRSGVVIRTRLIEGQTGLQVWSGRYLYEPGGDNSLASLETELMSRLAHAVGSEFGGVHQHLSALAKIKPEDSLTVAEALVTARSYFQSPEPGALRRAVRVLRRAIDSRPEEALLHASLAIVLGSADLEPGWQGRQPLREAYAHAVLANKLAPSNGWSLLSLALVETLRGNPDGLALACQRIESSSATSAGVLGGVGLLMCYRKLERSRGLAFIERARKTNPHAPGILGLGVCLAAMEQGDLGTAAAELDVYAFPDGWADPFLRASIAALQGTGDGARHHWRRFLANEPRYTRQGFIRIHRLWHGDYLSLCVDALRAAGIRISAAKWPINAR